MTGITGLALTALAGSFVVAAAGGLPENGTVKVLMAEPHVCESDPATACLSVELECKLKRRVSNWSQSLVKLVWVDPGGVSGHSESKGFDACRGEPGDRFTVLFTLPPAGYSYSIELP